MCFTNDHGYVPFVGLAIKSFPHSWLITGCVTRVTWWMPHVEQDLFTLPEHLSSLPVLSGVHVARSLVFCVMFFISLFIWNILVVLFLLIIAVYVWSLQSMFNHCSLCLIIAVYVWSLQSMFNHCSLCLIITVYVWSLQSMPILFLTN